MKKHSFMKKEKKEKVVFTTEELTSMFSKNKKSMRKLVCAGMLIVVAALVLCVGHSVKNLQMVTLDGDEEFEFASNPIAATASKKDLIAIPSGVVKANPFLPYRTIGVDLDTPTLVEDVPRYDLIAPPELNEKGAETARIMETVVSGILYDKYSPSAILKIDGTDYLVKKGDTVHNYKVTNIAQNSVTVQYGKNTFKAGIGELLTDGSVNYNEVSNLSKKFGGVQR